VLHDNQQTEPIKPLGDAGRRFARVKRRKRTRRPISGRAPPSAWQRLAGVRALEFAETSCL
jgi:hypothetical protein